MFELPILLRYSPKTTQFYVSVGMNLYSIRSRNFIGRTGYQANGVAASYVGTRTDNWLQGVAPKIVIGRNIFKSRFNLELAGTFNSKVPIYSVIQRTNGALNVSKPLARINILSLGLKYSLFDK